VLEGVSRRRIILEQSGVEIAVLDWGGSGPPALLHHANGFCAALWDPVAQLMRSQFRVFALDARGHGDSSRPEGAEAFGWDRLASDLVGVGQRLLAELGAERFALGLGHSFGGTLTLAAAGEQNLYERIALIDAVLHPPVVRLSGERGSELSVRARKRRALWGSRAEAREFFLGKPLFAPWCEEAIDLYIAEGLRERTDGQVELKCSPEVEASVFEGPPNLDNEKAASQLSVPALLVWAARGNFPRSMYQSTAALMKDGTVEDIQAGHLAPMERPELVADSVLRFCATSR
jgi:pimeloyl-ACP methyl ester carboxylesterase